MIPLYKKNNIKYLQQADADDFVGSTKNGIYSINVNSNNKNFPFDGGTLVVSFGSSSWGFQEFVPYATNNNTKYIRNYLGKWSSWKAL